MDSQRSYKSASGKGPSPSTEEDRVRTAFALPPNVALPAVDKESIRTYHQYLEKKLTFPFSALYAETTPPVRHLVRYVTVVGLSDNTRRRMYGLFCKVQLREGGAMELPLSELGIPEEDPNRQLVDDYLYWLWYSQ